MTANLIDRDRGWECDSFLSRLLVVDLLQLAKDFGVTEGAEFGNISVWQSLFEDLLQDAYR